MLHKRLNPLSLSASGFDASSTRFVGELGFVAIFTLRFLSTIHFFLFLSALELFAR